MRSLIYLGSALATYGGLLYFGKSTFLSFMSCSIQLDFPMRDVLFMYNIIHNYSMEGYTPINHLFIHVIQSLFFSLVFLCMFVRILSTKIYFMCFFLASLLISLIYYFYKIEFCNFSRLIWTVQIFTSL